MSGSTRCPTWPRSPACGAASCAACGGRTSTLHKLRHLAASLQIAAGIDIGTGIVSKRLRRSSIKITNDTYGHMIGTIGRQAAEAAAALVPTKQRQDP